MCPLSESNALELWKSFICILQFKSLFFADLELLMFHDNIVKITEFEQVNLLKLCLHHENTSI